MRRAASPPRGAAPVVALSLRHGFAGPAVEPAAAACARHAAQPAGTTVHPHRSAPR